MPLCLSDLNNPPTAVGGDGWDSPVADWLTFFNMWSFAIWNVTVYPSALTLIALNKEIICVEISKPCTTSNRRQLTKKYAHLRCNSSEN